jgi:hypothetical protein
LYLQESAIQKKIFLNLSSFSLPLWACFGPNAKCKTKIFSILSRKPPANVRAIRLLCSKFTIYSILMSSNFIDYVKIFFRSGAGGAGSSHFRREKFAAMGGPDGGDGGRGGHIILKGNGQLWTLLHLKYTKHVHGKDGEPGVGAKCTGAQGADT